jgi:hypothetical protein
LERKVLGERTKKELEGRFKLSATAVYETLKACGLDTSRREYTEEEIQARFIPARHMLEQNKKLTDVRNYFAVTDEQASAGQFLPLDEATSDGSIGLVESEIIESVNEVVQKAVVAIVPLIPKMVFAALEEQARQGKIRQAFVRFREEYRQNLFDGPLQKPVAELESAAKETEGEGEIRPPPP